MTSAETEHLQTLDRGLATMWCMARHGGVAGVADLARELHYDKSTVFRILRTMQRRGFVNQLSTGKYELRVEMFQLIIDSIVQSNSLQTISRPVLQDLAQQVEETLVLSARVGDQVLSVDKIEGRGAIHIGYQLGRTTPLYAGASGKVILAFLAEPEVERYLRRVCLEAFTELTPTTPEAVRQQLIQIRERSYAFTGGEVKPGVGAIASPILDRQGSAIGSVSVVGIAQQFDPQMIERLGAKVAMAAQSISARLGFRPDGPAGR